MQITYGRVHELFDYNGHDLIWKKSINSRAPKGSVAGYINSINYRRIRVDGKAYFAHRLIYLYCHGYMPENNLDHRDRNRAKNNIGNLREVSVQCNARNFGNRVDNKSGVKGVYLNKKTKQWRAQIGVAGKHYYLGNFKDFDEAVLLRFAAEQCLNWGSCDFNSPTRQYAIKNNLFNPPCL